MFVMLAIALIAGIAIQSCAGGARTGLWWGWLIALLLVPSWIAIRLGPLSLDLRTVAAVGGLALLWLFGRRNNHPHWLIADAVMAVLFGLQLASEYRTGSFGLLSAAELMRSWLLPYIVGRCFFGSTDDIVSVLPIIARATLVLSLYAFFEAITHINPINDLANKTYGLLEEGAGYRWGLKRAQAFFDHPIYFGFLLVLILPWAIVARRQSMLGESPGWWKALPFLVAGALACTASRGPIIAGIITACVPALMAKPRWWTPAFALAIVAAAIMVPFQEEITGSMSYWVGENTEEPVMLVVAGREVAYTGTNHRILLFEVYEGALAKLEPLGYGSQLRDMSLDGVPERFRSIDSHYVLYLLQRGPLGLAAFVLLALVTLGNLASEGRKSGSPLSVLAAGLCGSMTMVSLMLFSVWFAPDFGTVWLFVAGLAGNLKSLKGNTERSAPPAEWSEAHPRLAPTPVRSLVDSEELK